MTVATGPLPGSRLASRTMPRPRPSGLATSSSTSATSRTCSSRSSMPKFWRAEISTMMVSPPQASGTRPCSDSCCMTRLGSALSRSILLMATMIGHVGGLGVVEGLDGLRHHAVVGGHHQDDDVGDLGAPGAHGGERLVAGGVDEGDQLPVVVDLVGADVLGDAAGLAGHHVGLADAVQEERLAVVDVAHDGHDGRAGAEAGPRPPPRRRSTWPAARLPSPRRGRRGGRWRAARRRTARSCRRRGTGWS